MCLCLTLYYFEANSSQGTQRIQLVWIYVATLILPFCSSLFKALYIQLEWKWPTKRSIAACQSKLIRSVEFDFSSPTKVQVLSRHEQYSYKWTLKGYVVLRQVNSCSSNWRTKISIHISKKWLKVPNQLSSFTPFQKLFTRFPIQEEEHRKT